MKAVQTPYFRRSYKKLHANQIKPVNEGIRQILSDVSYQFAFIDLTSLTSLSSPRRTKTYASVASSSSPSSIFESELVSCGEEKKGDLAGVRVYKFRVLEQQFLLAYEFDKETLFLLALGVHENFYRDLKKAR